MIPTQQPYPVVRNRRLTLSPTLLTIPEVAAVFRVPKARAYELAREGAIPGVVRPGKQIRVDEGKLRAFLEAGGTQSVSAEQRPRE